MELLLQVRAGKAVLPLIRDEGLRPERVRALVGPALGPRWTATAGIDRALAASGFLTRGPRKLLTGGSAGAWRLAALAQRDPLEAWERFRRIYVDMTFTADQNLEQRTEVVLRAVRDLVPRLEIPFLLNHPCFDLCIDTVRVCPLLASRHRVAALAGYALAAGANIVEPGLRSLFMRSVKFCTPGAFPPHHPPRGETVALTADNLLESLAASAMVPLAVRPVRDIPGAPPGNYVDGGLEHYIVNDVYARGPEEVALLIYHGGPLIPTWLDKKLRRPHKRLPSADNLVVVNPGPEFIRNLPSGRAPDREDWTTFAFRPGDRIALWNRVIDLSMKLGDQFLDLVEGGSAGGVVQPLWPLG